jgi:hypothetical protein
MVACESAPWIVLFDVIVTSPPMVIVPEIVMMYGKGDEAKEIRSDADVTVTVAPPVPPVAFLPKPSAANAGEELTRATSKSARETFLLESDSTFIALPFFDLCPLSL